MITDNVIIQLMSSIFKSPDCIAKNITLSLNSFFIVLQYKPLNVIIDNAIVQLMSYLIMSIFTTQIIFLS